MDLRTPILLLALAAGPLAACGTSEGDAPSEGTPAEPPAGTSEPPAAASAEPEDGAPSDAVDGAAADAADVAAGEPQAEASQPEPEPFEPSPLADEPVSYEERLQRAYVYTVGANYVNHVAMRMIVEDERQRREAAGERVGGEVSEEVVEEDLQRRIDSMMGQDPNADFWAAVRARGYTEEAFRDQVELEMKLIDMFFPADPELWPVDQLQVALTGHGGSQWDGFLAEKHAELIEQKRAGEEAVMDRAQLDQFFLRSVWQWLRRNAEIDYPVAGLPEGVCLRVNGEEVGTEELYRHVDELLTPVDRRRIQELVDLLIAAEEELRDAGDWLGYAEWWPILQEEKAMYEGTIIPFEMMVTQFLGFPSVEIYQQFARVRDSFRTRLPDPWPQEMIDAVIEERRSFYAGDKVAADVIWLSVLEEATGMYPQNRDPFPETEERARELAQMLEDGTAFEDLLLEYSDYPEKWPGSQAGMKQPNRGRLPALSRNDLRNMLGENSYTDLLQGWSVGDDIFFHAEQGAVYGPVKSSRGYYFYKVRGRTPSNKEVDPANNPQQDFTIKDDLLNVELAEWLNGLRGA